MTFPDNKSTSQTSETPEPERIADYAMAFDLLDSLGEATDEETVIQRIFEFYGVLTGAEVIAYCSQSGELSHLKLLGSAEREELRGIFTAFDGGYRLSESGKGFIFEISAHGERYGSLLVEGFSPQRRVPHCLSLSLNLSKVFALALSNARKMEALLQAKRKIGEREELFRKVFEESPMGVAIVGLDYRFEKVNRVLCDMLGYTANELLGKTFVDITHPDDVQADVVQAEKLEKGEISFYRMEKRYIRKEGDIIWVGLSASIIRDEKNSALYFLAMIEDITELKSYHEHLEDLVRVRTAQLKKTHEQLLHSEKLSALGKLTGSIAHEFNNPIYGLRNIVEQTREEIGLSKEIKELLDLAVRECDRMAGLVRKLQGFYKPSEGVKTPVNIHQLLDDIDVLLKKKLQVKKIALIKNYGSNLPKIYVIEDQIRQVLLNLFNNAEEAIPDGNGKITVATESDGTHIKIYVKDTGEGIPEENMKHIFEPFFSTKGVKGTGLGLSVCYGIVKAHEGNIEVAGKPGEGTTFTLVLPAHGEI